MPKKGAWENNGLLLLWKDDEENWREQNEGAQTIQLCLPNSQDAVPHGAEPSERMKGGELSEGKSVKPASK